MEIIVMESEAFQEIKKNLNDIKAELSKSKIKNIEETWLSSKQVQKILGVSQKTWQTYRNKNLIQFSQIGQKIYVKTSWLNEFMERNSIKANK